MPSKTKKKEKISENKDIQETKDVSGAQLTAFDEMDKLFDRFLMNRWPTPFSWNFPEMKKFDLHSELRVPSVDMVEKGNNIIVRAEIPGVDKKEIDITLSGNNLTIQGKSKHETKEAGENYHRSEISSGSFSRTLTLPAEVDSEKVKASFVNGLLEITMPKVKKISGSKITIE